MKRKEKTGKICPHDNETCPLWERVQQLEERCRQLEALSKVDALTQFYNFRYMIEMLEIEMERSRRTGQPTGLVMVDLDHFKQVNDTYGHECGNLALRQAAEVWRDTLRRIDIPCRYGGEEFLFILPGTDLSQTARTAERLRQALERSPLKLNGDTVSLTGSFGVAAFELGLHWSAEDFINEADRFVLQAKKSGRNRVFLDESRLGAPPTEVTGEERALLMKKRKIKS